MLRIIHTGRAYEILDLTSVDYCRLERIELRGLRAEYTTLRFYHRQQDKLLGKTCREVWKLKGLLEATERALTITELELKSCQKSTHDTHGPQDPH